MIRCCMTCKHERPISAPVAPECCGCIKGGACTKWEAAGGVDDDSGGS